MTIPKIKLRPLNERGFDHVFLLIIIVLTSAIIGTYLIVNSHANPSPKTTFIDISEPQCGRLKSIGRYNYGIVGLNGVRMAFAKNPCLKKELRHFKTYGLYVGANYPSRHCSAKLTPYQCGQKAGKYDLKLMRNLSPDSIWIDVESGPGIPWSTPANNSAFVSGLYNTLKPRATTVGFYSNKSFWKEIMGNQTYANAVNWYAFGSKNGHTTDYLCKSEQFGGGTNVYVQWVENNLDHNASC